jgi:hypothetical protein
MSNIRYRYPLLSEQVNDIMDSIYNDIVRLIGYESSRGNTLSVGVLESLYRDIISDNINDFGTSSYISNVMEITDCNINNYNKALYNIKNNISKIK